MRRPTGAGGQPRLSRCHSSKQVSGKPRAVHYFTREEIEGELAAAGFRLEAHSITGYGRAVARLIVTEDAPDAAPRHVGAEMRQGPA